MSLFPDAAARQRLPVALVTGFLGSGKTTLINRLLRHPAMANTAIVINEFGDIALDQHFIEKSDGEVVVMANGCLCCTVQGDLEGVVGSLYGRRGGDVPAFDRLVIETTGLADPAPIMQLILSKPIIAENFVLDAVVATIDAVHGLRQLDEHDEAVKQAALADRIVVTKTDLADADAVVRHLAGMNPGATLFRLPQDEIAPAQLFGAAARDPASRLCAAEAHAHLHGIDTFAMTTDRPLPWRNFSRFLTRLKIRHGDSLLRVKGIVGIENEDAPIAIHGVHHIFHPPTKVPRRTGDDGTTRIVFIVRGDVRGAIEGEWRALTMQSAPANLE